MRYFAAFVPLIVVAAVAHQAPPPAVYRVAGTVVDAATNAPLAGAEVQVSPVGKDQLIEVAIADGDGHFVFDNLFAGKYQLAAAHAGYLQQTYQQHGTYNTAIVTGPNFDNSQIVFPLVRKCSISGTITDQDGEPVPNATVYLLHYSIESGLKTVRLRSEARTGNDGRYTAGGLSPGQYFLAVTAQPWYVVQAAASGRQPRQALDIPGRLDLAYPLTFYPGVTDDHSAALLHVLAGARLEANLTLSAVQAAHVTVERSRGANTNARLEAFTLWGVSIPVRGMFFSEQGQVFNVAPGRYRTTARWRDAAGVHSIRRTMDVRDSMLLDPKSAEDQRSVTAVLVGSSVRAGGLALRSLETLEVLRPTPSGDGAMRWPADELTGNRYELTFNSSEDLYIDRITGTNARVAGRVIELASDGPVQLKVWLARGRSSMMGRVQQNGAAVSGAMVLLIPEDIATAPGLIRRDQSDGDGTFSLTDIVPGRYKLLALEPNEDLEYARAEVMQPYLARGKQVVIEPGQRYEEVADYVGNLGQTEQSSRGSDGH
jgi:hypothetical protein